MLNSTTCTHQSILLSELLLILYNKCVLTLTYYCRLYKDAVKLQRLMQQTVHELLDIAQDSSSDDDESLLSMKTSASRGRGVFFL